MLSMELMETVSAETDELYKPDLLERLLHRTRVTEIMLGEEGDVNIAAQQVKNTARLGEDRRWVLHREIRSHQTLVRYR